MGKIKTVTVASGDGIGPEIMESCLRVLKEAEAPLRFETIEIGEKLYKRNYTSGISEESWLSMARTGVLLKSPITTPQGGGYKSLNVTFRKTLGLYANIRPSASYYPFVSTLHPKMDLVIVRENEEDIYSGIEYRQTANCYESLKLVTRSGSEKIIRYAFEYASAAGRKKVSCFSKDNIMKFTDGIFHKVFDEISNEYPSIESNHYIIDIGTAKLSAKPELFDVIVTSNLYGDIISDVAAEISGSVGLAGSSNIGENCAMFEAVHGSAPDIAGKNIANPSGLINASVYMLVHLGFPEIAASIENALKKTIEDGIHTPDIYSEKTSSSKVGTKEFTEAVIRNLGSLPKKLKSSSYGGPAYSGGLATPKVEIDYSEPKKLVGVDVFLDARVKSAHDIAEKIEKSDFGSLELKTISSKGLKLWPRERFETLSDHWALRFAHKNEGEGVESGSIIKILEILTEKGFDFIKTENLYEFGDQKGYSLAQGE